MSEKTGCPLKGAVGRGRPKGKKKFVCAFALSREVIDRLEIYSQGSGKSKSSSVDFLLGQMFGIMDGEEFAAKFPDYPNMPKRYLFSKRYEV